MAVEIPYNVEELALSPDGIVMEMPLYIGKTEDSQWLLPIEPEIAIRRNHIIAKRQIAKAKQDGSVKELWSIDDFEIQISGTFINPDAEELPIDLISKFTDVVSHTSELSVYCSLFEVLGISYIAILGIDLPPTQGIDTQDYVIRALSDRKFDLLSPIPF